MISAHIAVQQAKPSAIAGAAADPKVNISIFFVSPDKEAQKFYKNDFDKAAKKFVSGDLFQILVQYEEYLLGAGFSPAGPSLHGMGGVCYHKAS